MAGKLSAAAQQKIDAVQHFQRKVQHAYGLVEQFGAIKVGHDAHAMMLKRTFQQLKRELMGAGLDSMSQLAGSMELAAGRGSAPSTKVRILREGVGSLKFQLELEERAARAEDEKKQEEKQEKKHEKKDESPSI